MCIFHVFGSSSMFLAKLSAVIVIITAFFWRDTFDPGEFFFLNLFFLCNFYEITMFNTQQYRTINNVYIIFMDHERRGAL